MPDLLGRLGPIVRDLPPGQTLFDRYSSHGEEPSSSTTALFARSAPVPPPAPRPLFELFALRTLLLRTFDIPSECDSSLRMEEARLTTARENYRRSCSASLTERNDARRRFYAAHLAMYSTIIDGDMKMAERNSYWDSVVHLLRGDWYFVEFDFEVNDFAEPNRAWYSSISALDGTRAR